MVALAVLESAAAAQCAVHPAPVLPHHPDQAPAADCGMIPITRQEAHRLQHHSSAISDQPSPATVNQWRSFHLHWSNWRRRHQARTRWYHYRTHLALIA